MVDQLEFKQGEDMCRQERLNNNLQEACEFGDIDAVTIYIEQGADFTADDNYAIRLASLRGHLDIVKYLVEQGAVLTSTK